MVGNFGFKEFTNGFIYSFKYKKWAHKQGVYWDRIQISSLYTTHLQRGKRKISENGEVFSVCGYNYDDGDDGGVNKYNGGNVVDWKK